MKTTLSIIIIIFAFIYLPFNFYMTYLVYKHIHATELMWFLFWINMPMAIFSTTLGELLKRANKEK